MKISGLAFLLSLLAGVSYFLLFGTGYGYPSAIFSAIVAVFRVLTSLPSLIQSKGTMGITLGSSVLGILYIAALLTISHPVSSLAPLALEVSTVISILYIITHIGKAKQPSPLDMPVYG